jgi:hypothetical protein
MVLDELRAIDTMKQYCNTDNFNTTLMSKGYGTTIIGFTQKYYGVSYYVDIMNAWYGADGIRVTVHKYGKSLFDYESEIQVTRKKDLWKIQRAIQKSGIHIPLGEIKRMLIRQTDTKN